MKVKTDYLGNNVDYITPGKVYDAFFVDSDEDGVRSFYITIDSGYDKAFCLLKGCAHLGGRNWIIVGE